MFYWALNRTGGCGLVSYDLGEAPVPASSEYSKGCSRSVNSGTFSTLWETVGFPRAITLHLFFIYGFLCLLVLYLQFFCRKWVQFHSLSKLIFTNRSILCRSAWWPFSIEAPPYGLIGKNSSSIHSTNHLTVLHEKSDVSDITLYKLL